MFTATESGMGCLILGWRELFASNCDSVLCGATSFRRRLVLHAKTLCGVVFEVSVQSVLERLGPLAL